MNKAIMVATILFFTMISVAEQDEIELNMKMYPADNIIRITGEFGTEYLECNDTCEFSFIHEYECDCEQQECICNMTCMYENITYDCDCDCSYPTDISCNYTINSEWENNSDEIQQMLNVMGDRIMANNITYDDKTDYGRIEGIVQDQRGLLREWIQKEMMPELIDINKLRMDYNTSEAKLMAVEIQVDTLKSTITSKEAEVTRIQSDLEHTNQRYDGALAVIVLMGAHILGVTQFIIEKVKG